jgi:hypothetical protein
MLELLYQDCWEAVTEVLFTLLRVKCITIPFTDLTTWSAPIDQNGYRAA